MFDVLPALAKTNRPNKAGNMITLCIITLLAKDTFAQFGFGSVPTPPPAFKPPAKPPGFIVPPPQSGSVSSESSAEAGSAYAACEQMKRLVRFILPLIRSVACLNVV